MDPTAEILLLAGVMFVGTFFFGFLPTFIKASPKIMNLISVFGAGLLVGVALIVIIPEGMLTLAGALEEQQKQEATALQADPDAKSSVKHGGEEEHGGANLYLGASLVGGFTLMMIIDQGFLIFKQYWNRRAGLKEPLIQAEEQQEAHETYA